MVVSLSGLANLSNSVWAPSLIGHGHSRRTKGTALLRHIAVVAGLGHSCSISDDCMAGSPVIGSVCRMDWDSASGRVTVGSGHDCNPLKRVALFFTFFSSQAEAGAASFICRISVLIRVATITTLQQPDYCRYADFAVTLMGQPSLVQH